MKFLKKKKNLFQKVESLLRDRGADAAGRRASDKKWLIFILFIVEF